MSLRYQLHTVFFLISASPYLELAGGGVDVEQYSHLRLCLFLFYFLTLSFTAIQTDKILFKSNLMANSVESSQVAVFSTNERFLSFLPQFCPWTSYCWSKFSLGPLWKNLWWDHLFFKLGYLQLGFQTVIINFGEHKKKILRNSHFHFFQNSLVFRFLAQSKTAPSFVENEAYKHYHFFYFCNFYDRNTYLVTYHCHSNVEIMG